MTHIYESSICLLQKFFIICIIFSGFRKVPQATRGREVSVLCLDNLVKSRSYYLDKLVGSYVLRHWPYENVCFQPMRWEQPGQSCKVKVLLCGHTRLVKCLKWHWPFENVPWHHIQACSEWGHWELPPIDLLYDLQVKITLIQDLWKPLGTDQQCQRVALAGSFGAKSDRTENQNQPKPEVPHSTTQVIGNQLNFS